MSAAWHTVDGDARPLVVALHCSGGTAGQWRSLRDSLEPEHRLLAPNLHGAPGGPVWRGERRFHLADEALAVMPAIEACKASIHLVGHSFGGALALHIASRHPERIASLTLYEPTAFHLLKAFGPQGLDALREIDVMSSAMRNHIASGAWRKAAACFVDYWNGQGAWEGMRPELQAEMVNYLPKTQLDFHALMNEPSSCRDYGKFDFPVRLVRGEHAPFPTRLIAHELAVRLPEADLVIIGGAGHMGPLTHPDTVVHATAAHIRLSDVEAEARAAA